MLAYETHGAPGRPWAILSGALATDRRLWRGQVEALAGSHRVLIYEHPGHGESRVPEGSADWHVRDLAKDVVALMDALSIEKAAWIGLSLGGSVGMQLALDYPHRVSALAFCCARADAPGPYVQLWKNRSARVAARGMTGVAEETLQRWFATPADEQPPHVLALARQMIEATDPAGYTGCAGALSRLDMRERLQELSLPVLFVAGGSDQAIPPQVLRELHERVPDSHLVELAGAGHLLNLDSPAAFNECLTRFLRDAE